MELNVNEPLTTCRKELSRRLNCRYFSHRQDNCNGQAGYSCPTASFRRGLQVFRHLGGKNITQAFIRNVRGLPVDVLKALQEVFFFRGRLFSKSYTVHTATQFWLSQEKQQEASDVSIVARKFL